MQRGVIKFQAPFEKIRNLSCNQEVKLYKSIIVQSIIDASNISESRQSKKLEKHAKNWIFNDSHWFTEVCNRADLEVSFVRKICKRVMSLNEKIYEDKLYRMLNA
ncbi:MAG TPA: hypothetical protein QKA08_05215 [Candidatus Megaira endosymbiont of Nemacystus decipiens]|nr:hypothetical protein [Candidatus Megaera endosymbiont of Nemacystus decipiens]